MSKEKRQAIVTRPNCETWGCEECAEILRKRWTARIAHGAKTLLDGGSTLNFLTVTSHEKLKTFAACHAVFPNAWSKLYAAMKRRKSDMHYALVPERHKDGRMHVHILTDFSCSKKWLKDNARRRGLGYQADVENIESAGHAAAYVSKYLGKGLGEEVLPANFRRVRLSQNWEKLPELHEPSNAYDWLVCRSSVSLLAACEICQKDGLTMVDLETGELFDYADMVERIETDALRAT